MEKEDLINQIWKEKNGREDWQTPETLYVVVNSARPNMGILTATMLESLSEDPFLSKRWARSWGKVMVCVGIKGEEGCQLGSSLDEKNKVFIPLATTKLVAPKDFFERFPKGNLGQIFLNNKEMTLQALLISYVHMVDEFIWNLAQKIGDFGKAIEAVKNEGFCVNVVAEDEILNLYEASGAKVRLYGSGVEKSVPKVMGAVVIN